MCADSRVRENLGKVLAAGASQVRVIRRLGLQAALSGGFGWRSFLTTWQKRLNDSKLKMLWRFCDGRSLPITGSTRNPKPRLAPRVRGFFFICSWGVGFGWRLYLGLLLAKQVRS